MELIVSNGILSFIKGCTKFFLSNLRVAPTSGKSNYMPAIGGLATKCALIMKMVTLLLLVSTLQVSAKAFSQKITFSGKNLPVEKVLSSIKAQSGYLLFYDYALLQDAKLVSLDIKAASVEQVMDILVKGQPFVYAIENKTIVLSKKPSFLENISAQLFAPPTVEIKGHVFGENGDPLQGAYIILKGNSKKAAITNAAGEFTLSLTPQEMSQGFLVFSYVGYNKYEYRISGHKNIDITLAKNIQALTDVVVTNSYSKPKRKEEVTGSIVTVSSKQLQTDRPIESFDKMLEGMAAGVQVVTNTDLGTPVTINIRGQNSLTNLYGANRTTLTTSSQPLFVVDGVPIMEQRRTDEPLMFINNEQLLNPLAGINPNDIESISILKDAAAASIYGSNASNGVVIITTKKGKAGKTKLNVHYSNGWAQSINKIKWLDGKQYHDLLREELINDRKTPADAELLAGASDINTPWFELANRYSTYDAVDLDLAGGNDVTQFRVSSSYKKQQAIQKGNDYEKIYVRFRLDHAISKKFSLGITLAPSLTHKNGVNVYGLVPITPNAPVYNADGTFFSFANLGVANPIAVIAQNKDYATGGSLNGNTRLEYSPFKNLHFSTLWGVDALLNRQSQFSSAGNATGASKNGSAQITDRTNFSWINTDQVNWSPTYKKIHNFDLTAGFEAKSEDTKLLGGSGSGFTYTRLIELSTAKSGIPASSKNKANTYSYFSQLLYNYDGKYFVSLSTRLDAASIFGNDVNQTINSGVGVGWLLSKEKWFNRYNWLDMLRVRESYGKTGNSRIGSYEARGIYTFNGKGYNDMVTSYISTAPNPDLTWEAGYKQNTGIDIGFLKRFTFSLDIYENNLKNAINSISIPPENGFNSELANVADMRNRGWDAGFIAQIFTGKFKWTSTLNVGYNKNVVTRVFSNVTRYASQNSAASVLKTGVSTSAIWGFRFAGVDPATGYEQFYDKSEGKVVLSTDLDRTLANAYSLGDRLPKAQGGFINSFSYEGVSLTLNMIYSFGAKALIDYNNENNGRNLQNRNQSVNLLDRWQKPGDIANIPRLSSGINGLGNPIVSNSSRYVYDDTYIKISNLSLSYSLPQSMVRKLKGVSCTVYGNATNLYYWYKEKSPAGRNGIREYKFSFPEAQTFTWGVKMGM
ncbi:SusC/RagA family TonB-linked outer membrane protein [Parasediminibacterium sp. JCM 36343]|uniref:SusC/RagA family TonB-linked outer membrane protein n=1 Tax=Parasediminibacterium sp. JCM 36343 TaxID=3374279 RepID=UPI00397A62CE